jgi:hypothetical protein
MAYGAGANAMKPMKEKRIMKAYPMGMHRRSDRR